MFRRRQAVALMVMSTALVTIACGVTPSADTGAAEAIVELGDAVNSLRQDNALLQSQIDSLRTQVARQDTLIARLSSR